MTQYPYRTQSSPHFTWPSILAVIAALASLFVSAGWGFILAVAAIILGGIGFLLALMPGVRGGLVSIMSILIGVVAIVVAIVKFLL